MAGRHQKNQSAGMSGSSYGSSEGGSNYTMDSRSFGPATGRILSGESSDYTSTDGSSGGSDSEGGSQQTQSQSHYSSGTGSQRTSGTGSQYSGSGSGLTSGFEEVSRLNQGRAGSPAEPGQHDDLNGDGGIHGARAFGHGKNSKGGTALRTRLLLIGGAVVICGGALFGLGRWVFTPSGDELDESFVDDGGNSGTGAGLVGREKDQQQAQAKAKEEADEEEKQEFPDWYIAPGAQADAEAQNDDADDKQGASSAATAAAVAEKSSPAQDIHLTPAQLRERMVRSGMYEAAELDERQVSDDDLLQAVLEEPQIPAELGLEVRTSIDAQTGRKTIAVVIPGTAKSPESQSTESTPAADANREDSRASAETENSQGAGEGEGEREAGSEKETASDEEPEDLARAQAGAGASAGSAQVPVNVPIGQWSPQSSEEGDEDAALRNSRKQGRPASRDPRDPRAPQSAHGQGKGESPQSPPGQDKPAAGRPAPASLDDMRQMRGGQDFSESESTDDEDLPPQDPATDSGDVPVAGSRTPGTTTPVTDADEAAAAAAAQAEPTAPQEDAPAQPRTWANWWNGTDSAGKKLRGSTPWVSPKTRRALTRAGKAAAVGAVALAAAGGAAYGLADQSMPGGAPDAPAVPMCTVEGTVNPEYADALDTHNGQYDGKDLLGKATHIAGNVPRNLGLAAADPSFIASAYGGRWNGADKYGVCAYKSGVDQRLVEPVTEGVEVASQWASDQRTACEKGWKDPEAAWEDVNEIDVVGGHTGETRILKHGSTAHGVCASAASLQKVPGQARELGSKMASGVYERTLAPIGGSWEELKAATNGAENQDGTAWTEYAEKQKSDCAKGYGAPWETLDGEQRTVPHQLCSAVGATGSGLKAAKDGVVGGFQRMGDELNGWMFPRREEGDADANGPTRSPTPGPAGSPTPSPAPEPAGSPTPAPPQPPWGTPSKKSSSSPSSSPTQRPATPPTAPGPAPKPSAKPSAKPPTKKATGRSTKKSTPVPTRTSTQRPATPPTAPAPAPEPSAKPSAKQPDASPTPPVMAAADKDPFAARTGDFLTNTSTPKVVGGPEEKPSAAKTNWSNPTIKPATPPAAPAVPKSIPVPAPTEKELLDKIHYLEDKLSKRTPWS